VSVPVRNNLSMSKPWRNPVCFLLVILLSGCGFLEWPSRSGSYPQYGAKAPENITNSRNSIRQVATVKAVSGDTVYKLARRHKVSVRDLIDANRLRAPYRLRAGQTLILPRSPEHIVKRGDTLYGIAQRHGVGMFSIARANGLREPYLIRVGQSLKIPKWGASVVAKSSQTIGSNNRSLVTALPKPRVSSGRLNALTPAPNPITPLPPPELRSSSGFVWPVNGKVVSRFGAKAKGLHNDGINISTRRGTPVRAADNGVVAYAGNELRGFGNLLLIKHSGGWVTAYAHNETLLVKRGQRIKKGQPVARVGSSGTVNSPQLHFELRRGKRAVDPQKYLSKLRVQAWVESLASIR
jgi:murein DD-endopeptidase MepM/ murein hydrolase activator NlpD